ncbi:MAG: pitrilysin family protein [Thermoguttaceae bacterium]
MAETIFSHTYHNGLVLVAERMDGLESAAFTFAVPSGCVDDPPDRSGLSSFTCEMMLRGAGPRDSRQFIQDLDNLGVERSESVTDAHTKYSGATVAANLPAALAIYADVLCRPHLPADQLESGRQAMVQELRAVDDEPAQKVMIELRRDYYPAPWGRPSQGDLPAVEKTTIDDIRQQFARCYRPNGAIVGVAGRFEWETLKDTVGQLLGDWQPGKEPDIVVEPATKKYDHVPFEASQTQIGIAYPSVPYRHPDYYQAWAGVGVLSGGMSARLFTEVRERRGLCYTVYAVYHTLREMAGVFCYAGSSAERAQETVDVMVGELVRLGKGIESEELSRLKARIKSALIMQQESSSARSAAVTRDWYHLGRVQTLEEINQRIEALTCESINAYLAEHPPADFTFVTLGPSELEVPVGVS